MRAELFKLFIMIKLKKLIFYLACFLLIDTLTVGLFYCGDNFIDILKYCSIFSLTLVFIILLIDILEWAEKTTK